MPKHFTHKGAKHVVISPSSHMLQSTLISDVVARGGLFSANLETGTFGIIPANVIKEHNLKTVVDAYIVDKHGLTYVGTVDEEGIIKFYIRGNMHEFKNLFEAYKFINKD